jgi:polysaccharide transporter, PST family
MRDIIKNKKVRSNFIALLALYIVNYTLPLFTIPYLSRILSVEHYGVVLYVSSFVIAFFNVCEYGFNYTGVRDIALAGSDHQKVNKIFSGIMYAKFCLYVFSVICMVLLAVFIPKLHSYAIYYLLGCITLFGNVLYPTWLFRGVEKMGYITFIGVMIKVSSVGFILLLVHNDHQFYYVIVINMLVSILAGVVSQFAVYYSLDIKYVLVPFRDISSQLLHSWPVFLSNAALSLYNTANSFFLGVLTDPVAVAYYVAAEKFITLSADGLALLNQVLFPDMVKKVKNNFTFALATFRVNLISFAVLGGCISVFMYVFSPIIIKIMFSNKYEVSVTVLKIMAVIPFISSLSSVLGQQVMLALKLDKLYASIVLKAGILNVILIFLIVPHYSFLGSGVCVVITELFVLLYVVATLYKKGIYVWNGSYNKDIFH